MKQALAAVALLAAAACGGVASRSGAPMEITGTIDVFAAASLTDAFNEIAADFHKQHSAATVRPNYGGSSTLVTQITQGAPADVFASADQPNMQKASDAGVLDGAPRVFATNRLQIVVQAGNPKGIKGLADLANPSTVVVLCAPVVPCGSYAGQALSKAGVKVTPRSQEQDVKSVVAKVALGEADAGIVYVTDVKAGGAKVAGVDIPDDQNVVAKYPVAVVKGGSNAAGGRAFVDFLLAPAAQAILAGYGFGNP